MSYLELEQEVSRMSRAMMTRNRTIGADLVTSLKVQLSPEAVAGVMLISLERLVRLDAESFVWSVENLIPADVMQEIWKITAPRTYSRLVKKGLIPGKDFSAGASGQLFLNSKARAAISPVTQTRWEQ
ncbi:hypothetical protein [Leptolyngbya sp. FACHB-261]|uniref:hypothetical protein n=1 Tax=Leptolyngbya sp. FACHB-261 TaxID=2692806 RepID=UPI00168A1805|nr:hypothetical protein [Leptolyngbya sp. FACHB-261]MBD2100875.1 hypothetical protein [Leptolyngbya sp. FACHB-261]